MTTSPDLSFQTVLTTQIAAALPAVTSGAHPTPEGTFPYVSFGQSDVRDDFPPGFSITVMVHTWSKLEGPHEVKTMQDAIRVALHSRSFTLNEWTFSCVRQDYVTTILDVDNETWHGVQRFKALAGN